MSWRDLPLEVVLAVVDALHPDDVKHLAAIDYRTYHTCIPALFQRVHIANFQALESFLESVPRSYCAYILELSLFVQDAWHPSRVQQTISLRTRTESAVSLLLASQHLQKLTLHLVGSLDKSIIDPFAFFTNLTHLSIANHDSNLQTPLSERLVVSIAASVRNLRVLSLDNISRSKMHAPDLHGVYPSAPLVLGDADIPDHPILGAELSLPSLLRIPTLRQLSISDTHLGDERWTTTPLACKIQVLELGCCGYERENFNQLCTERIMAAVGPSVKEFSLTTAVRTREVFEKSAATPLPRLRKLHITPFFPVDMIVDTMSNLAGSPIECVSLRCYHDDLLDVCGALVDFLEMRAERGPRFYDKLRRIDVSVTPPADGRPLSAEDMEECAGEVERLHSVCRDLKVMSVFGGFPVLPSLGVPRTPAMVAFADGTRAMVKARSMTM